MPICHVQYWRMVHRWRRCRYRSTLWEGLYVQGLLRRKAKSNNFQKCEQDGCKALMVWCSDLFECCGELALALNQVHQMVSFTFLSLGLGRSVGMGCLSRCWRSKFSTVIFLEVWWWYRVFTTLLSNLCLRTYHFMVMQPKQCPAAPVKAESCEAGFN